MRDKAPVKLTPGTDKLVVSLGDKANVTLKLARVSPDFKGNFQVTPNPGDLPTGK